MCRNKKDFPTPAAPVRKLFYLRTSCKIRFCIELRGALSLGFWFVWDEFCIGKGAEFLSTELKEWACVKTDVDAAPGTRQDFVCGSAADMFLAKASC
jgi:hypothetical protein